MKNRPRKKLSFLAFIFGIVVCSMYPLMSQSIVTPQSLERFRQAFKDVRQNSTVMIVAVRPGEEDLQLTSYYRYVLGSKVIHAFITNGEAGCPDVGVLYPTELAAHRRVEADSAARAFDAEAWFLNFPDFAATPSEGLLRATWQSDSLQYKIARLIALTRPSIIFICRDPLTDSSNRLVRYLEEVVLAASEKLSNPQSERANGPVKITSRWNVEQVYVYKDKGRGWVPPTGKINNRSRQPQYASHRTGDLYYRIQAEQRKQWFSTPSSGYSLSFPKKTQRPNDRPPAGRPSISKRMQGLQFNIDHFCKSLERAVKNKLTPERKLYYDHTLLALLKNIDSRFTETGRNLPSDRRLLEGWREGLLSIRQLLYGIEVHLRQSETILTNVQIVFITVDSLKGLPAQGTTDFYISDQQRGWYLNETLTDHIPIHAGETFRLLSPGKNLRYNFPVRSKGLKSDRVWEEIPYTIIHLGATMEESFIIHQSFRFMFSEKIDIEPLQPIVRLQVGEQLPIILINHSRDGVHGRISLRDSFVQSTESFFRLRSKEDRSIDTVTITHVSPLADTTLLVPVVIDSFIVNAVAGRSFPCSVDSSVSVSVLTSELHSSVTDAVRRIGIRHVDQIAEISDIPHDDTTRVLIVADHALRSDRPAISRELFRYAEKGGHVLVLSQNLSLLQQWQQSMDFPPSRTLNSLLDSVAFELSNESPVVQSPNRLTEAELQGFVLRTIYCQLQKQSKVWDVPLFVRSNNQRFPGILTRIYGAGRITYSNLALSQQWLNIHPGSLRLLANILSWKNE